jgi:hypothetical protein
MSAKMVIQVGFALLVIALVLRVSGFDNYNTIPPIGTTPGAIHRLVDSVFLLGIGLGIWELKQALLNKKGDDPSDTEKS